MPLGQLVRYGAKGGSTMLLNIAIMAVLIEAANVPPLVAAGLSLATVLVIGYILMHLFVFPNSGEARHLTRVPKYYGVILTGKLANYAIFAGLLTLNVWYPFAWFLGAGIVFFGTYSANHYLWHGTLT